MDHIAGLGDILEHKWLYMGRIKLMLNCLRYFQRAMLMIWCTTSTLLQNANAVDAVPYHFYAVKNVHTVFWLPK